VRLSDDFEFPIMKTTKLFVGLTRGDGSCARVVLVGGSVSRGLKGKIYTMLHTDTGRLYIQNCSIKSSKPWWGRARTLARRLGKSST